MKLSLEFQPSPLRCRPLSATRFFGGGGGGSADQTQEQTQNITTTQSGASDSGTNVAGDGNTTTVVHQDVSADAIAEGMNAAAYLGNVATWLGADAQETARNASNVAYWLGESALDAAQGMAAGANETAQHQSNVAYWLAADAQDTARHQSDVAYGMADAALDAAQGLGADSQRTARDLGQGAMNLAYGTNAQNTGLLANLARLFTGSTTEIATGAIGGAYDFARDITSEVADNYSTNTIALAQNYQKSLEGIEDLAKSTTTGGQTEVNKSFVKIIGLVAAAVVALIFLSRK